MTFPLTPGSSAAAASPPPANPTLFAPLAAAAPAAAPPSPVDVPVSWLLQHGSSPVQYRTIAEIARIPVSDMRKLSALPYSHRPALTLAVIQRSDGSWNGNMLGVPSLRAEHFEGVGTINAVRRLLEYGWEVDSPPMMQARRVLFRLLAEDDDPSFLYELAQKKPDQEMTRHGRTLLREAAAAALAQAGYEKDPRLRGAARRIVERLDTFLKSPLAQKPFTRSGNVHVLAAGASPPSWYTLVMLAFMPLFRSEHYDVMDRLYNYLSQPQPRQTPASMIGKRVVEEPQLVLGDPLPHRNAVDADVPAALAWLELAARMQFLRRNEGWMKLFDRFLDDRDNQGVWRPARHTVVMKSANPYVWPTIPLDSHAAGDERWADVTFRLALIGRWSGRPLNLF
ncbi:MAG: hypothetical protein ACR2OG_08845 [Gemmatimonadaceae bacterium]